MTDTAPKKGAPQSKPDLRSLPKRSREQLTDTEFYRLQQHLIRHPGRTSSWLSEMLWVTEELVNVTRGNLSHPRP